MTIEAWLRVEAAPSPYATIISKSFGNGTDDSFAIWYQEGALLAGTNVSSPTGAARFVWAPDAVWHFVAWTHALDGTEALYFDATLVGTATSTTPHYDDHPLLFGADFGTGTKTGFFVGALDRVHLWDVARSATEVANDENEDPPKLEPDVVASWSCDEGQGQIAYDATGAHDAQLGAEATMDSADPTWITR